MADKHTPGPWAYRDGDRMRHDNSAPVYRPAKGERNRECVAFAADFNRTDRDEEVAANARLIANAPELLDALSRIFELANAPHWTSERRGRIAEIALRAVNAAVYGKG